MHLQCRHVDDDRRLFHQMLMAQKMVLLTVNDMENFQVRHLSHQHLLDEVHQYLGRLLDEVGVRQIQDEQRLGDYPTLVGVHRGELDDLQVGEELHHRPMH
jgi:hypothetical protein